MKKSYYKQCFREYENNGRLGESSDFGAVFTRMLNPE